MSLPDISNKYSIVLLRTVMGIIFITHGTARLYFDSVSDFGNFLDGQGFLIGLYIAWTVTIGELVFGTMLAVGYKIRYCVLFHFIVIIAGLFLIHIPQGWFVVGHGSGGVEYSLLILAVLVFLYSSTSDSRRR